MSVFLSVLFVALVGASETPRPAIDIEGNIVLVDAVYRNVALQGGTPHVNQGGADLVRDRILSFLREAGYDLARADGTIAGGRIVVRLDEGRVGKVIVHGQGTLATLGMKYVLMPADDIYNRYELEARLSELLAENDVHDHRYEITTAQEVEHHGPQVDPLVRHENTPLGVDPEYELHVYLEGPKWPVGLSIDGGLDTRGALLDADYRGTNVMLLDDRWQATLELGADYFDDLSGATGGDLRASRLGLAGKWYSPSLYFEPLRALIEFREQLARRQRQDLGVSSYYWNRIGASASLALTFADMLDISMGAGAELRDLSDVEQPARPTDAMRVNAQRESNGFWLGSAALSLSAGSQRLDRRHRFSVAAQLPMTRGVRHLEGAYDGVLSFGWNDLALSLAGAAVGGSLTIAEAIPMSSRFLRGVFSRRYYMSKAGGASGGFQLSLARDLLKVGAFADVALFKEHRPNLVHEPLRGGIAAGPGLHVLVLDALQLHLYYSFAAISDGRFDHGVSVDLEKAF